MTYYEIGRGGAGRIKYCEPALFGEWTGEELFSNDRENKSLSFLLNSGIV